MLQEYKIIFFCRAISLSFAFFFPQNVLVSTMQTFCKNSIFVIDEAPGFRKCPYPFPGLAIFGGSRWVCRPKVSFRLHAFPSPAAGSQGSWGRGGPRGFSQILERGSLGVCLTESVPASIGCRSQQTSAFRGLQTNLLWQGSPGGCLSSPPCMYF